MAKQVCECIRAYAARNKDGYVELADPDCPVCEGTGYPNWKDRPEALEASHDG